MDGPGRFTNDGPKIMEGLGLRPAQRSAFQGWQCPVCGRGNAPTAPTCPCKVLPYVAPTEWPRAPGDYEYRPEYRPFVGPTCGCDQSYGGTA